ncbi:MAG: CHAT domain-containing protein [Aureispira sp.]|nr:CHAT domain-containing protein [Aureispira sp.]
MRIYIIVIITFLCTIASQLKGQTTTDSLTLLNSQVDVKTKLKQWDSCWIYLEQYYDVVRQQKKLEHLLELMVAKTNQYLPNDYLPRKAQKKFLNLQLRYLDEHFPTDEKAAELAYLNKFYFYEHEENRHADSAIYYLLELNKSVENSKHYVWGVKANSYKALNTYKMGNKELALEYLTKAEEQAALLSSEASVDLSSLYQAQGYIYAVLMQEEKALEAFTKHVEQELKQPSVDSLLLGEQYSNLARIYTSLGNHTLTIVNLEKAIAITPNQVIHNLKLAEYYYRLGLAQDYINIDNTLAIDNMSKSLHLLDNIEQSDASIEKLYIDNYQAMAQCYISDESWPATQKVLDATRAIHKKNAYQEGYTYFLWGEYFYKQKDLGQAKTYATKAYQKTQKNYTTKHSFRVEPLLLLGQIANAEGQHKKALDWYQEALREATVGFESDDMFDNPSMEQIVYPMIVFEILKFKVEALLDYANQKQLKLESWELLDESILVALELEELIRESFSQEYSKRLLFKQTAAIYESAIYSSIHLYKLSSEDSYLHKAFELSEKNKAVILQQSLQEHKAQTFGGVPDSLIEKENRLQKHIAYYKQNLLNLTILGDSLNVYTCRAQVLKKEEELQELKHQLRSDYSKYYDLKYSRSLASVTEIQEVLDDSTCLMEYFLGKELLYTFGITKDSFWFSQESIVQKLKANVEQLLAGIESYKESSNWLSTAHELYAQLIAPHRKNGIKRLYIIPDNVLFHIPFDVLLCTSSAAQDSLNSLDYLLRHYAISYNYSARIWLNQLQDLETVNYQVMAMAADYSLDVDTTRKLEQLHLRQRLAKLPTAAKELELLGERYDGLFYADRYASEYYFKKYLESYGLAHLAMYTEVNSYYPEYSSIVFSEDAYEKEDNFLYAQEIKQLSMQHLAMVILSASQTEDSQEQIGEGVLSLGRNFVYAGVPSLVMNLWKLNDQTSSQLIRRFYDNLQEGMPKDQALRQAKLAFLDEATGIAMHPAFWANYVHFGNYENITIEEPINKIWWFIIPIGAMALLGWWGLRGLRQRRRL